MLRLAPLKGAFPRVLIPRLEGLGYSIRPRSGQRSLDICRGPSTLRRSKTFIVTGLKHAISSVGAASNRNPQVGKCVFGHAAR
jgi:hypothetical protein